MRARRWCRWHYGQLRHCWIQVHVQPVPRPTLCAHWFICEELRGNVVEFNPTKLLSFRLGQRMLQEVWKGYTNCSLHFTLFSVRSHLFASNLQWACLVCMIIYRILPRLYYLMCVIAKTWLWRGTNISLNILSHPSEHADPASLLPSSLPSSLSYLLQQCNEGHLDVLEEVMDIMKTLVENGGWNSCSGISVLHMMWVTHHLKSLLLALR